MNNNSGNIFKYYLELSKLKIMIPVSLTGFTGYFIFDPHLSLNLVLTTTAILLLAISASVLNQIQEIESDRMMTRTHNRPLPSGRITLKQALLFFFFNFSGGLVLLCLAGNLAAALIGLFTIFWYNGIYTCLKRVTAFAVVPGAVSGALPPLIGWIAAGGGLLDKPIIFLEFLFFTGQIPHFWLLIIKYGEEYRFAGIRSLTEIFSRSQINRLTFIWVISSVIAALYLCYFKIIRTGLLVGILLTASVLLIWQFSGLIKKRGATINYDKYLLLLNFYFLLVMILLISDRIIA